MPKMGISLYVRRKSGLGQSLHWCLRSYLPSLLIFFITLALAFALVFVYSVSDATEEVLRYLGSGDVAVYEEVPQSYLPSDAKLYKVASSGGVAYSADNTALLGIRSVSSDYFFEERRERMKLELADNTTTLGGIIISRETADELGVTLLDRIAVMMYEEENGRARPYYLLVEGLYSSGYSEFDSVQAYTTSALSSSSVSYEIFTEADASELALKLRSAGYAAQSSRELYSSIWSNIELSVSLLSVIVIFVAVLAGFFAISISAVYIERDSRDIASLMLVGFSKSDIVCCYRRITITAVAVSALLGMAAGVLLSYGTAPLLSSLDTVKYPALGNYVLSFSVHVPLVMLICLYLSLLLASYISLKVTLSRYVFSSLKEALVS